MVAHSLSRNLIGMVLAGAVLLSGCGGGGGGGGNGGQNDDGSSAWLIPPGQVVDGGPGKDGIPAIDQPAFESAATISTVAPDEFVVVVRYNGEVHAFPHDIMNWHEIVNDGSRDDPFSVSYCPLTGSAVAWHGDANAVYKSFGVSGLLFNSNLILYDRKTDSNWSQMQGRAVNGPRIGEDSQPVQVVEMEFATLQQMYPDAQVMTRETSWENSRDYDQYPYGPYLATNALLFPADPLDNRLHLKTRVIGLREGSASRVFQLDGFGPLTQVINDQIGSLSFVVVGNSELNFAAIYESALDDGTILAFTALQGELPNVMSDDEGNVWSIFGTAVSGPRAGEQLKKTSSYTAFWFAWAAFFPDPEIHFN